jgi:hypothetical protein
MRYLFFALAFVALACSKADPPTEPEAPIDTEAAPAAEAEPDAPPTPKAAPAPPAPETAPTVTLLDAGKPPLQELRRTFKKGHKETMSFAVGETVRMKGGGWDHLNTSLVLDQSIDIETVAVSEDGVANVTLEVREAKELEKSVRKPNTKQMNTTGVTGSYKINTEGVITELTLDPPPHSRTVAKPFLDSMRSKLRWMAPPFPKEPVGVGAKWTVAAEVNEFVTRMKEEVTVELVKRTGSEIVLSFEVKSTGVKHHDWTPPQDVAVDVETRGQAKLNPNKVLPRSSKLAQQIVQAATILGPDAPEAATQTLTYEVKIRSK